MKNNITRIFAAAALCLSLASCSKEFLETTPTEQVATASIFTSASTVEMAINGMAYLMCSQHTAFSQGFCGESWVITRMQEWTSQEYSYAGLGSGWKPIMNSEWLARTNSQYIYYAWVYYYEIIGNANTIICNIDAADALNDAEKAFYKAQALTFRAYCYEKLLQFYAPRWVDSNNGAADGVVLRIDESTDGKPLSTMAQCYKQIYDDCDDAIAGFTASGMDRAAGDVWLTNINVAYAVYARAALARQDYSKAAEMAAKARNGYPLMDNAAYKSGFCAPTSEWIFGAFDDSTENKWYWSFGVTAACNGNNAGKYNYGSGVLDTGVASRIPTTDVRMSLFLTADKFPGHDLTDPLLVRDMTYGYFLINELELDASNKAVVKKDANDEPIETQAHKDVMAYVKSMTPAGFSDAFKSNYVYPNGQIKFWVTDLPGVGYVPFIRSSEMYLIEAEAKHFDNDDTGAQAALVALNATSGRNPAYTCTKTGTDLFDEIVDYRSIELFGEGFNWFDYKRWKKPIVRTAVKDGGVWHTANAGTFAPTDCNNWVYALPEVETLYNSEIKK